MTKEELQKEVSDLKGVIARTNEQIYSAVMKYINCLPYKVGDKVSSSRASVSWIASIKPEKGFGDYTGRVDVRINPAKKDGTRSNRELIVWPNEIDSIVKID